MHCIMFRLSIYTMELLVVGYDIFCEFYVVHKLKELKSSVVLTVGIRVWAWGYGSVVLAGV